MKNFAYAKQQDNDYTLFLYEDDNIPVDASEISALMMNRLNFDVKIIEIPPVGEEEVGKLLNYRLRSIYPGDPGDTSFDFKIITKNKKKYAILFITSKKNIETYKELAPRKPLYLPYNLAEYHMKKEPGANFIYFFWDFEWIDVMIFEEKGLVSSIAIKREKELFLDILKIKNILPKNYAAYKCVVMSLNEEYDELIEKSKDLFNDTEEKIFLILEELFTGFQKAGEALFRRKNQMKNITHKFRIDVLAAAILLLCCLWFNKHVNSQQAFLDELITTQQDKIEKSLTLSTFQMRRNQLLQLRKNRPMDAYLLLSELSKIMAGDALLYTFRMRNRDLSFEIEGEAYDPNKYNNQFKTNTFFKDAKIDEIVAIPGINKGRFKASGVFNANQ